MECNTPQKQKEFIEYLKRYGYISTEDILEFAEGWFELENPPKLDGMKKILGEKNYYKQFKDYLSVVGIKFAESEKEGGTMPLSSLVPSNINSNFTSNEIAPLFTSMQFQQIYFEQNTKQKIMMAAFIGDLSTDHFTESNTELNRNICDLKNKLFREIIDFLIGKGKLNTNDFYTEIKDGSIISLNFNSNLFNNSIFDREVYKTKYKRVIKALEDYFLSGTREIITLPNGQKIPNLRGKINDTKNRKELDIYGNAILLLNFDSIISDKFGNIITVNPKSYKSFTAIDGEQKYFLNAQGTKLSYFKDEEDLSSDGVDQIEDDLSKNLCSIIPYYNQDNKETGTFLEKANLDELGAIINKFESDNLIQLYKIPGWKPLEEDPTRMLYWYLNSIIDAHKNGYTQTIGHDITKLPYNTFLPFKYKIGVARSLSSFLESINLKENNFPKVSVTRVLTQLITNSMAATYSTYDAKKDKVIQKNMSTHNHERISLQNQIYEHLKNNEKSVYDLTNDEILTRIRQTNGFRFLINDILGIFIENDSLSKLSDAWLGKKSQEKSEKIELTKEKTPEELAKDKAKEEDTYVSIFKTILDTITPPESNGSRDLSKGLIAAVKAHIDEDEETYSEVISDLLKIKQVQELLDVKLGSVHVKALTTITTSEGKRIPTYVIPSLGQNDTSALSERHKIESSNTYTGNYRNFFVNQGGLEGTIIELEAVNDDEIKPASKFNVIENFNTHFNFSFIKSLESDKINTIGLAIGNLSDKSRIIDKAINKFVTNEEGKNIIIKERSDSKVLTADKVFKMSRNASRNYYNDLVTKITDDYSKIKVVGITDRDTIDNKLSKINAWLNGKKKNDVLKVFLNTEGVNFIDELHYASYTKPDKTTGYSLNQTILDYYKIYNNDDYYKEFINNQKESLVQKLLNVNNKSNLLTTGDDLEIIAKKLGYNGDYSKFIEKEITTKTDEDGTEEVEEEITNKHLIYVIENDKLVLNPLLEKWFAVNEFFRNEYLYLTVKGEYMHPAKKSYREKEPKDINDFFEQFNSESGVRLSGMAKRNVSFTGTTEMPSRNDRYGVVDNVNIAVLADINNELFTVSGNIDGQDVQDGASFIPWVYSKMISNSYPGKGYDDTKKQLATFITEFGSALKKDAESVITNARIRDSRNSEIKWKNKYKQIFGLPIEIKAGDKNKFDSGTLFNHNRYYKGGNYYLINKYILERVGNKNILTLDLQKLKKGTTDEWESIESSPIEVKNLYDVWEAFGAEDSVNTLFEFDESSNEQLFNLITGYSESHEEDDELFSGSNVDRKTGKLIKNKRTVIEYPLKDKMIHILSNKSTFKSGAANVHPDSYWYNSDKLKYMTYRNKNMGIQQNSSHDIVDSKLKEVTQLISALAQNPDTADKAREMYEALANIIKTTAEKSYNITNSSDLNTLYKKLSADLVREISSSNDNDLTKTIVETLGYGSLLPFSNPNFFQKFIKNLVSKMNEDFITRYYPGSGFVLVPSHRSIQVYEGGLTQSDALKLAIEDYRDNFADYLHDTDGNITNDDIVKQYISKKFPNDDKATIDRVQVGDIVKDGDQIIRLDTLESYYSFIFSHQKNPELPVTIIKNIPRDLKPIEIIYDRVNVDGTKTTENLFLLDPVRIRFNTISKFKPKEPNFKERIDKDKIILEQFKAWCVNKNPDGTYDEDDLDRKLTIWTNRALQALSFDKALKRIEIEDDGTVDFKKYFGEDKFTTMLFKDYKDFYLNKEHSDDIVNYKKNAAELIVGNIYKNTFKTGNDSIAKINSEGAEYFRKKLDQIYTEEKDETVADFSIITDDNKKVYVKFVENLPEEKESELKNNILYNYDEYGKPYRARVNSRGESLYKIPNNAVLSIGGDGKEIIYIKTLDNIRTKINNKYEYKVQKRKDVKDIINKLLGSFDSQIVGIIPLMNNSIQLSNKEIIDFNQETFSTFRKYSGYIPTSEDILNKDFFIKNRNKILNQSANKTFISWKKSLEFVSSRIPAQSMQSFMEMKNVGYMEGSSNNAYVSILQIFIQGSDFRLILESL